MAVVQEEQNLRPKLLVGELILSPSMALVLTWRLIVDLSGVPPGEKNQYSVGGNFELSGRPEVEVIASFFLDLVEFAR